MNEEFLRGALSVLAQYKAMTDGKTWIDPDHFQEITNTLFFFYDEQLDEIIEERVNAISEAKKSCKSFDH